MYVREQLQLARDSAQEIHNRLEDAQQEVEILNDKLGELADEVEVEIRRIIETLQMIDSASLPNAQIYAGEAIADLIKLVEAI